MSLFMYLLFYSFSLFSLSLVRKHILLVLMCLEFMVLCLLMFILMYCLMYSCSLYIYLYFMVVLVCEAALGLGILVYMIRCMSNDYIYSFTLW